MGNQVLLEKKEKESSITQGKKREGLLQRSKRKQKEQKPHSVPFKKSVSWKDLAQKEILFDEQIKEHVYTISEPLLSSEEKELKKTLIRIFRIQTDIDVYDIDETKKVESLTKTLEEIISANHLEVSSSSKDKIFYYIIRDFIGYGKIDVLMHDDEIEDISCDGKNVPIFVYHRKYESIRSNIEFNDDEKLNSFVVKLAQICGKQISIYEPIIDGKLPDGSRLQATLAKTVTASSTFTIRRFREKPLTPIDLINSNTLSLDMVAYFWLILEYGSSILFCGGTASGKTTMLNAMSLFIPGSFKIVSVEDTREINLPHENWIAGTTRTGFSTSEKDKSTKDIDMFDLIKAALRQRPRVIIVGEVRGKEAYVLFQAMATGHLSYSTVHASDIQTLIQRLESPPISLPRTLLTSLDVLVFLNAINTLEGTVERRVKSVVEIIKLDPGSQRLISVTPFSWISPADDRFERHGGSNILEKIRHEKGWNTEELEAELNRRKKVLTWMQKKNVHSYTDVGNIVSTYKKDAEGVLKKIEKDEL